MVEKYRVFKRIGILLVPITCITAFCVLYYWQEQKITDNLNECSFYTIANPIKMSGAHTMYFKFFYGNREYEDATSVGAGDLGYNYTRSSALSTRYWVRIYCSDFKVNRVYWEAKVPDTLQYIPLSGWKEIPYNLSVEK